MTQLTQVSKHNTTIFNDGTHTVVKFHYTDVVKFNHREIVLDSNGYQTYTTKVRMNQASNQYNLGYYVYQRDFEWFVNYQGRTLEFYDGMVLER